MPTAPSEERELSSSTAAHLLELEIRHAIGGETTRAQLLCECRDNVPSVSLGGERKSLLERVG